MIHRVWIQLPSSLQVLSISHFLIGAGFYLLIPYLAVRLTEDYQWSVWLTGLLLGVRQLSQQGLMFPAGALADRLGWKNAIVLGLLVRGVGFGAFALCSEVWHFFLAAIISALGGALFAPASQAAYRFLTPSHNSQSILAFRTVISSVAFVLASLLGTLVVSVPLELLAILASTIYFFVSWLVYKKLPEIEIRTKNSLLKDLRLVLRNTRFVVFTLMLVGYYYLHGQLFLTIPKAVFETTGSAQAVAWVYGAVGITILVLQLRVSGWFRLWSNRLRLLASGVLIMGCAIFFMGQVGDLYGFILLGMLYGVGVTLTEPLILELVGFFGNARQLGGYFGFSAMALAFGGALGSFLGGTFYELRETWNQPWLPWTICLGVAAFVALGLVVLEIRISMNSSKNHELLPTP